MKKSQFVFLASVVLLALTVSAHVFANPAAITYGAQTPIVEKELRELQPQALLSGDLSVISMRNEPVGSRAAENLEVTLFHGLKLKMFASTLNLKNVQRVWFGFPRNISEEEWQAFASRTDTKCKYREANKNLGKWVESMPAGANNWQAYAPSDILEVNAVTNVIIKAEGDFNHSRTRILWLITIGRNRPGTLEDRLRIRCVEPPPGLDKMPRDVIFRHLVGFWPAWSAPVVSQMPGEGTGNQGQDQRGTLDKVLEQLGLLGNKMDRLSERVDQIDARTSGALTPTIASPPQPEQQEGMVIELQQTEGETAGVHIRPLGGFERRGETFVIDGREPVYAVFDQPVPEGCHASAWLCVNGTWHPENAMVVTEPMYPFWFTKAAPGHYILNVSVFDSENNVLYGDEREITVER